MSFSPNVRDRELLDRLRRQGDGGVADRHDRRGRRADHAGDAARRRRGRRRPPAGRRGPARRRDRWAPRPGAGRRSWSRRASRAHRPSGCIARRSVPGSRPVIPTAVCPADRPSVRIAVGAPRARAVRVAVSAGRSRVLLLTPCCLAGTTRGGPLPSAAPAGARPRPRSPRSLVLGQVPYLVLGAPRPWSARFLLRRRPWARWLGVAAALFLRPADAAVDAVRRRRRRRCRCWCSCSASPRSPACSPAPPGLARRRPGRRLTTAGRISAGWPVAPRPAAVSRYHSLDGLRASRHDATAIEERARARMSWCRAGSGRDAGDGDAEPRQAED